MTVKDAKKWLGVLIACLCATWISALFMNFNLDLARLEPTPEQQPYFDLLTTSGEMTIAIMSASILLITGGLLIFYVKNFVDQNRPQLGVLKSLGYTGWEIGRQFGWLGLPTFVGASLGLGIAYAMMPLFYSTMLRGTPFTSVPLHFNGQLVGWLLVLPSLFFSLLAIAFGTFKLREPVLDLVKGKKQKNRRFSLLFFIFFAALSYSSSLQIAQGIASENGHTLMTYLMMGIGSVLALTCLAIGVGAVLKGNAQSIALFKAMGYTGSECYRFFLGGLPAARRYRVFGGHAIPL